MQTSKPSRSPLFLTRTMVWLLLIGYGLFLVGRSTYANYQTNQDIAVQKKRVQDLERINQNLELALVFYKTNAYKDVEARRRLNLKGKDEHVVALPDAKTEPALSVVAPLPDEDEDSSKQTPYRAWWNLFFGA